MTARIITNLGVEEMSDRAFFARVFGHAPKTKAEKEAERQAAMVKHRAECRRELEETRDRLCALASPELQAKFREKWAAEDALAEAREQRRFAA